MNSNATDSSQHVPPSARPVERPAEIAVRFAALATAIAFVASAAAIPGDAAGFGERLALGYGAMVGVMAALRVDVRLPGLLGAFGCAALIWKNPPHTSYGVSIPLAITGAVCFCLAVWSISARRKLKTTAVGN